MKNKQTGSAHVIVVIVLILVIIGALGYVVYKNLSAKNGTNDSTASRDAPKTPEETQQPIEQKLISYCTPKEKFCFEYPEGWSLESKSVTPEENGLSENVSIKNAAGVAILQLQTGIGGIGGTCPPEDYPDPVSIIDSQATKVTGSYLVWSGAEEYYLPTIYATKTIEKDASGAWSIGLDLTNRSIAAKVGDVNRCDLGFNVFSGKNLEGSIAFGTVNAINGPFATKDAAQNWLSSEDGVAAYKVISSAHY